MIRFLPFIAPFPFVTIIPYLLFLPFCADKWDLLNSTIDKTFFFFPERPTVYPNVSDQHKYTLTQYHIFRERAIYFPHLFKRLLLKQ